ncbi:MAG: STAS domain-containing protein [Puniceicoccales bacterium]|nr:STAS domain-containing protein [Puniceicoccales bacterium]
MGANNEEAGSGMPPPPAGGGRMHGRFLKVEFPLLRELRHYDWRTFRADAFAGGALALISIPQAIGFALIIGLPPGPVVLAVMVGGAFSALFFTSHHHVFGPTSSGSLIVSAAIASAMGLHAGGLSPLQLAVYMALIIGVVQFVAGLLRFGEVTKFISRSVVVAYSSAIGLTLVATQLHSLLGIGGMPAGGAGGGVVQALLDVVDGVVGGNVAFGDAALGVATLVVSVGARQLFGWRHAGLLVLLVFACVSWAWVVPHGGEAPFRVVGDIQALRAGWPEFEGFSPSREHLALLPSLLGGAVAIALIGMLESASITKGFAARSGQRVDANQELLGMGVGNIANALFGAVPGSSSFTRSAALFQTGARTQMASVFSSIAVFVALLLLAPLFNHIPLAALAAVLVQIGAGMLAPAQIRVACRSTRSDAAVFALTLAAALFARLDIAIYAGIGLSLALFLQKTSSPVLVEYSFDESGSLAQIKDKTQRVLPQIAIIHVEGELYFGAADVFLTEIRHQARDENIRLFILRLKNARHLDASTVMALESLHESLGKAGRHLLVSGCTPDVMKVFRDSGILKILGTANVFEGDPANPNVSTRRALLRACEILGSKNADIRVFYDRRRKSDPPLRSASSQGPAGSEPASGQPDALLPPQWEIDFQI